jgi:hypothetical protein
VAAGGVAKTVAKVIAFLAFMAVAVVLFRKDSLKSFSDWRAMRKCPEFVQADLSMAMPFGDPKVVRCEGSPAQATCFVETTENMIRKTAPVKNWDCTKQHLSANAMAEMMGAGDLQAGETLEPGGNQAMERMQAAQHELGTSIQYVRSRLRERRELLEEQ